MSSNSAEKESKAKKPSDKEVDLSNCNRGVWLVKVPKYISERWEAGGGAKMSASFRSYESLTKSP